MTNTPYALRRTKPGSIRKMAFSAVCLTFCMVLPFLTGQIPQIGSALCPMHLPVLLAGFLCGSWWAAGVGFTAPVLRFMIFGMPPLFPAGLAMCFELAAYGLVSGWLYQKQKSVGRLYLALICAMAAGRLVWGAVMYVLMGLSGSVFTWPVFLAGAVFNAVPGIILQLVLVPVLVLAVERQDK